MKLEMIGGPQGPTRCADGGGHLLIAGEADIAKGTICIADYAGVYATATAGVTASTTPGDKYYAENIMVEAAGSLALHLVPTSLFMVAMEDGPSSAGGKMRFSEVGHVKVKAAGSIAASHKEVCLDVVTGITQTAATGDLVIGRQTGTALSTTAATMYFDGSRAYLKA